jgi:3D (Asp-Asp-Asp) domain-containing protein
MRTALVTSFGFVLGGITLCSCSTPKNLTAGDPLEPGKYAVRRAMPADTPSIPKNVPTQYFTVEQNWDDNPTVSPGVLAPFADDLQSAPQRAVRTTAYCQSESDHIRYGNLAAAGAPLRFGMVCSAAADWSRYPLGTRFRIKSQPDVVYEVDDYGSALVGSGTIDLYRPTMGSMNAWGVRTVDIEITQWGSYEESMRLMRDRVQFPHVRHMMLDIQRKLDPIHFPTPIPPAPDTVVTSGVPLAKIEDATASL